MAISKIVQNSLADTISLGPKISSVQVANSTYVVKDDTNINIGGGYIVITGSGFQSNCSVIVDSNLACSVAFVSATQVRAELPAKSAGTYNIYLLNGDGGTAIRVNALQYSNTPTWVTASPLASQVEDSVVSIQLAANGANTYSLQTGSTLPTGLSLSANGLISGTVNTNASVDTTFNFTVEAIDTELQETPKAFAVTITISDSFFDQTVILLDGDGTSGANNNVFRDSSNNNFAITRFGNTEQGSFSPFSPSGWSNFLFESRVNYTSSGVIPQPLTPWSTGTGTGTIEAWIYPTALDGTGGFNHTMSTIVGIGDTYFAFGVRDDLKLRLYWWTGSQNFIDSTGTIPGLNQWIHVAITRNNGNIQFFINGVSAGTSASYTGISSWGTASNGQVLQIGQNNGSGGSADFYGYISNLRLSNSVRSVSLPTAEYTSDGNTLMLTCMSSRFRDIGPSNYALTTDGTSLPKVVNFSPFAPSAIYSVSTHGGSAFFDGTGDYLDCGNGGTNYNFGSGDYTVECWFYPTARPLQHQAITHKGHVSNNNQYDWRLYWGTVDANDLLYWEGTGSLDTGSNKVQRNSWNHIAVVRSGGNLYLYLNGTRASTTASGSMGTTYPNIYVGTANIGGAGVAPTNGYISGFNIIKGTAKYTDASITPPTAPSVPVSGTELLLNYTNAGIYDWTTRNTIETVGNAQVNTSVVKHGTGSIFFNGSSGYLFSPITHYNDFKTGDFTLEAWIRFNTVGNGQLISAGDGNNGGAYYWQYFSSQLQFGNQGGTNLYANAWSPSAGVWYHVAISRQGTSLRHFVDGTQLGSTVTNSTSFTAGPTFIGWGGAGYFNGNMDDVRITKGFARYTSNFTPPSAHAKK